MSQTTASGFDTAVLNRENHLVALVQVKWYPASLDWKTFLPKQLEGFGQPVPFVLAIDPDSIYLFQWNGSELVGPVAHLETASVLQHYEPEYGSRRIFKPYLTALVEAWLRDLAYHWKLETPPGAEELQRVGFLGKFEGGTTQSLGD